MPASRPPEVLEAGAIYSSREFKSRLRIGEAAWRKMKKEGLKVYPISKTVMVRTEDFVDFLMTRDEQGVR